MRTAAVLATVLALPGALFGRPADAADRKQTIQYVLSLQRPNGGFAPTRTAGAPTLRGTLAAARALKYLTEKPVAGAVPHADQAAAFVLACFDPKTGGFADTPGGKPDVVLTSVGVMAAAEFGVPRAKFAKAMGYLKENAKTFEEVRLGAAAVEAWGVKDCPFDLAPWVATAARHVDGRVLDLPDGGARELGSVVAFRLRLGAGRGTIDASILNAGQLPDGGWKKAGAAGSELDTSYRVMRAYYLLKAKPADVGQLRRFLARCRNADGGYGVKPGDPSTAGAVYYAAIISHWLDELGK